MFCNSRERERERIERAYLLLSRCCCYPLPLSRICVPLGTLTKILLLDFPQEEGLIPWVGHRHLWFST